MCQTLHRLSTIQDADRIVVVNKGAVQEVGTHEELLEKRGFYSSLVARQMQKSASGTSLAAMSRSTSRMNLATLVESGGKEEIE